MKMRILTALLMLLGSTAASADIMAIVHTGCASGDTVGKCTAGAYVAQPTANQLVRICGSITNCWSAGEPRVVLLGSLSAATLIDACDTPGIAEGAAIPYPWSAASDPCKHWQPTPASTFAASPPIQNGAFRVTWTPPTQNTDASALTDLAGFWIYSAAAGAPLGKLKQVTSPTVTSQDLTGYSPGVYQFAVSAYNAAGVESALSPAITKDMPAQPKIPKAVTDVQATPLLTP